MRNGGKYRGQALIDRTRDEYIEGPVGEIGDGLGRAG